LGSSRTTFSLLAFVVPVALFGILVLFAGASMLLCLPVAHLLFAKRQVLDSKEVNVFFGLAKLVAWDPTEAVLILKDKQVSYVDDNLYDGGGIKIIYPILGEELVCRAPLEIQTLDFRDSNVMTKEYLPLMVEGTMKWRITSLQRFYLLVSQKISQVSDLEVSGQGEQRRHDSHSPAASRKLASTEQWLRFIAEEQTRSVVSHVNTGLLIAEGVVVDLPPNVRETAEKNGLSTSTLTPTSTAKYRNATDGLAAAIHEMSTLV
jgi:hypothetical protein